MYEVEEFPTPPWRRRLLIVLLALATAATVVLSMIYRPGGVQRTPPPPAPDVERCTDGQTSGCVGGRAEVILMTPAPGEPASASSGGASMNRPGP